MAGYVDEIRKGNSEERKLKAVNRKLNKHGRSLKNGFDSANENIESLEAKLEELRNSIVEAESIDDVPGITKSIVKCRADLEEERKTVVVIADEYFDAFGKRLS